MSYPEKFNMQSIIVDLSKIEIILKTDSAKKDRFLRNFEKWIEERRNTLAQLEKLQKELDDICFQAKVGKLIGVGSTIVGTAAAVVGFGLSFSREESIRMIGKNLAKWGVSAGAIGAGTASVVSTAVESIVNQRILTEVKTTLNKDYQMSEQLLLYVKNFEDLNSLFCEVFDCDISSSYFENTVVDVVDNFFTVVRGITSLCMEGKYAYEEISEAFLFSVNECSKSFKLKKIKRIFQNLNEKVQFVLIEFCRNSKARKAIWKIEDLITSPVANLPLTIDMFSWAKCQGMVCLHSVLLAKNLVDSITKVKDIASLESIYSGKVANVKGLLLKELNEANRLVNPTFTIVHA